MTRLSRDLQETLNDLKLRHRETGNKRDRGCANPLPILRCPLSTVLAAAQVRVRRSTGQHRRPAQCERGSLGCYRVSSLHAGNSVTDGGQCSQPPINIMPILPINPSVWLVREDARGNHLRGKKSPVVEEHYGGLSVNGVVQYQLLFRPIWGEFINAFE